MTCTSSVHKLIPMSGAFSNKQPLHHIYMFDIIPSENVIFYEFKINVLLRLMIRCFKQFHVELYSHLNNRHSKSYSSSYGNVNSNNSSDLM